MNEMYKAIRLTKRQREEEIEVDEICMYLHIPALIPSRSCPTNQQNTYE